MYTASMPAIRDLRYLHGSSSGLHACGICVQSLHLVLLTSQLHSFSYVFDCFSITGVAVICSELLPPLPYVSTCQRPCRCDACFGYIVDPCNLYTYVTYLVANWIHYNS